MLPVARLVRWGEVVVVVVMRVLGVEDAGGRGVAPGAAGHAGHEVKVTEVGIREMNTLRAMMVGEAHQVTASEVTAAKVTAASTWRAVQRGRRGDEISPTAR